MVKLISTCKLAKEILLAGESHQENDPEQHGESKAVKEPTTVVPNKGKGNSVPRLIDNKRKHLERKRPVAHKRSKRKIQI